jgi:hypothetical protein
MPWRHASFAALPSRSVPSAPGGGPGRRAGAGVEPAAQRRERVGRGREGREVAELVGRPGWPEGQAIGGGLAEPVDAQRRLPAGLALGRVEDRAIGGSRAGREVEADVEALVGRPLEALAGSVSR